MYLSSAIWGVALCTLLGYNKFEKGVMSMPARKGPDNTAFRFKVSEAAYLDADALSKQLGMYLADFCRVCYFLGFNMLDRTLNPHKFMTPKMVEVYLKASGMTVPPEMQEFVNDFMQKNLAALLQLQAEDASKIDKTAENDETT